MQFPQLFGRGNIGFGGVTERMGSSPIQERRVLSAVFSQSRFLHAQIGSVRMNSLQR
jgi:hypothetical protein